MKNEILEFALSLASAAEAEILPVFRKCTVSFKSDGTEVTEADRRAEEAMRARIEKQFPKHRVLGEEFGGSKEPTNDPIWVLDPIDGTTSFALGLPVFGTLIAYLEGGDPLVGVIHYPAMGETIYAAKGMGCWSRLYPDGAPQQIRTSSVSNIADAFISAGGTTPTDIDPVGEAPSFKLSSLIPKPRKFRFVCDCVQHALVAQGRIDAAIDPVMNPWDIAALIPCVEEAGGVLSDLHGNREHLTWRDSLLSSANQSLHSQILRVLQGMHL
jgi:histidinol-phosphatase